MQEVKARFQVGRDARCEGLFDFLDVMLGPEGIEQVGQAFVRERNRWLRDLAEQGWS